MLVVRAALAAAAVLLAACAASGRPPPIATGFEDYRRDTIDMLQARRHFQATDKAAELAWNAPREWLPATACDGATPATTPTPDKGILLIHGLGDSPWSFHDVARQLAGQGFLVRTVLLPGHGTRPQDLLDVTLEDWQRVVREQADALRRDVAQVYLGGFSTGANLALDYAYAHPEVAGLVLFSPAFQSSSRYDWLTPLIGWFRPWLLEPDGRRPMQNAVRYMTVPTNAFAQFWRSSREARQRLAERPYDKPVFMAVAQHDSVLDTAYLLSAFQQRFTHPVSRLVWYGARPAGLADGGRVLVRSDALAQRRISRFSHMGLMFSPANPLYGERGSLRICWNGQDEVALRACERGEPVWYSDWGYREPGKVHARLTFNPYFEWQGEVLADVLNRRPGSLPQARHDGPVAGPRARTQAGYCADARHRL
ncbi:alpha/beta hydrolase [Cupriavidus alkaliphilus]|uniref:Esterase/lipase n=1 Tax=Cupriavidus alkaliphilus TaxID=942866 RepID=A0A7W4YU04_9BURK|nr:alpha/beta fold hydrolase [Cupriavidus alkaliphilus]MBB3010739.1 esterase/lipase [Cupriavidus alkaliphilus]